MILCLHDLGLCPNHGHSAGLFYYGSCYFLFSLLYSITLNLRWIDHRCLCFAHSSLFCSYSTCSFRIIPISTLWVFSWCSFPTRTSARHLSYLLRVWAMMLFRLIVNHCSCFRYLHCFRCLELTQSQDSSLLINCLFYFYSVDASLFYFGLTPMNFISFLVQIHFCFESHHWRTYPHFRKSV